MRGHAGSGATEAGAMQVVAGGAGGKINLLNIGRCVQFRLECMVTKSDIWARTGDCVN